MKSILLAVTFVLSTSAFAKAPATETFQNVLKAGTYKGLTTDSGCVVVVATTENSVSVTVKTKKVTDTFVVVDSSPNYSINEVTGEIAATQSLSYPFYLNGGTKILNVKTDKNSYEGEVYISNILLDHKGNDASTFVSCNIAL